MGHVDWTTTAGGRGRVHRAGRFGCHVHAGYQRCGTLIRSGPYATQRLRQIVAQVFKRFQANADPHQAVADAVG